MLRYGKWIRCFKNENECVFFSPLRLPCLSSGVNICGHSLLFSHKCETFYLVLKKFYCSITDLIVLHLIFLMPEEELTKDEANESFYHEDGLFS